MSEYRRPTEVPITESERYTTASTAGYVASRLLDQKIIASNDWYKNVLPGTNFIGDKDFAKQGLSRKPYSDTSVVVPNENLHTTLGMDRQYVTAILLMGQTSHGLFDPKHMLESCVALYPDYFTVLASPEETIIYAENIAPLFIELLESSKLVDDWNYELAGLMEETVSTVRSTTGSAAKAYASGRNVLYKNLPPHIPKAAVDAFISHPTSVLYLTALNLKMEGVLVEAVKTRSFKPEDFYYAPSVMQEKGKIKAGAPILKILEQKENPKSKRHEKTRPEFTADALRHALGSHAQQLIESLSAREMTAEEAARYSRALVFNAQMQEESTAGLYEASAEEQARVQELLGNMTSETLYALMDVLPPDLLDYLDVVCNINEENAATQQ